MKVKKKFYLTGLILLVLGMILFVLIMANSTVEVSSSKKMFMGVSLVPTLVIVGLGISQFILGLTSVSDSLPTEPEVGEGEP